MNTPTPTPRTDEVENKIVDLSPSSEGNYFLMKAHARKLERELTAVTEQRDRLAEALEHTMKHMRHSLNCPPRLTEGLHACNCQMEWSYDNATEALQSLNQPKQ